MPARSQTEFTRHGLASLFLGGLVAFGGCGDSASSTPKAATSTPEIDAQNNASAEYQKQKEAESKAKGKRH